MTTMKVKLNFPDFNIKTRTVLGKEQIWDGIRLKWLALTPEEWVRQNLIMYLVECRGVSSLYIKQEMGLDLHGTRKRADIVIYGSGMTPGMVIECKAPEVKITRETLEQVARYNMTLGLPYTAVTNGLSHYCFRFDKATGRVEKLTDFPSYQDICATG